MLPTALSRSAALLLALAAAAALAQKPDAPPAAAGLDLSPVPVTERRLALPEGWQRGAFIEIFVRAWKDSNGDGIGDLKGLTQTLDHLQELGVRGIWLMPVTANADGDHGYATTDFRAIAPEYGTLADFDELLREAAKRGIGVIMDYVINHASAEFAPFRDARANPASPFRDWFVWSDEAPAGWDIWGKVPWYHTASAPWTWTGEVKDMPLAPPGSRGFYFGTFGPHMPDFNFRNPVVRDYHFSSLRFWLNRGLAGYRLDAVPHLVENNAKDWNDQPESRALTREIVDLVHGYERRVVVCEATAKPQDWGDPAVCGGAFAFGHVHHYVQAAQGKAESVEPVARYFETARPTMATFVSNHDTFAGPRLWDAVKGDERRYKLAAAAYLLQPGTPYIYYGEHIGQAAVPGLPGDGPIRSPMAWTADPATGGFTSGRPFRPLAPNAATHHVEAQRRDPGSIFNFYKGMLKLRNTMPSISEGRYFGGFAQGQVAGWQREWKAADAPARREHTVVLLNYGERAAPAVLNGLPAGARLLSAWPEGGAQATKVDAQGRATLLLAPHGVRVLRVVTGREAGAAPVKRKPTKPTAKARAGATPKKAASNQAAVKKTTPRP